MPLYKRAAILAVVGLIAAVVAAVAAVGPQAKRGAVGTNNAANVSAEPICPQAPWPFGCQWDEPKQKPAHKRHSSQRHDGPRQRAHPRPDLALTTDL